MWLLKSRLIWKRGKTWNKYLEETHGCYCDACPKEKWISEYQFWRYYSPINSRG